MPYTVPTPADLKAKFPAFNGISDDRVQDALDEARRGADTTWFEADYQPAILYLAAHLMVADGVLSSAAFADLPPALGTIIESGAVSEVKVGDVTVKLRDGAASSGGEGSAGSASGLGSTVYGRRYLALLRLNQPAVALV